MKPVSLQQTAIAPLNKFTLKTPADLSWVKKHKVVRTSDANGNGDDVFNATNMSHALQVPPKDKKHGYVSPKDQSVNDEVDLSLKRLVEAGIEAAQKRVKKMKEKDGQRDDKAPARYRRAQLVGVTREEFEAENQGPKVHWALMIEAKKEMIALREKILASAKTPKAAKKHESYPDYARAKYAYNKNRAILQRNFAESVEINLDEALHILPAAPRDKEREVAKQNAKYHATFYPQTLDGSKQHGINFKNDVQADLFKHVMKSQIIRGALQKGPTGHSHSFNTAEIGVDPAAPGANYNLMKSYKLHRQDLVDALGPKMIARARLVKHFGSEAGSSLANRVLNSDGSHAPGADHGVHSPSDVASVLANGEYNHEHLKNDLKDMSDTLKMRRGHVNEDVALLKKGPGPIINSFVHSDEKRFAGKSKHERIRMALGEWYRSNRAPKKVDENQIVETAYQRDLDEKKPIVASGVMGAKSKSWKKTFKNMDHFSGWHEKNSDNYEVHYVQNKD